MIRRGTPLSRTLALAFVATPLALLSLSFVYWSIERWIATDRALAAEDLARHEAEAKVSHAGFYGELGEAWRDYADTEISGLAQEPSPEAAETAVVARLDQLFARHEGAAAATKVLARSEAREGVQRLRFETRGRLPEAALASFLETLETQPPFLFVDLMELRAVDGGRAAKAGLSQVDLRLRLSAYRIKEADR